MLKHFIYCLLVCSLLIGFTRPGFSRIDPRSKTAVYKTTNTDTIAYPAGLRIIHTLKEYNSQVIQKPDHKLVELVQLIPSLALDIRYAGNNNFMHTAVYSSARAFLVLAAATKLQEVEEELNHQGLGLIIYDAYRPYQVTLKIFDLVKDSDYAASGKTGSRHNRGCAVDLALVRKSDGKILEMPTQFDSFSKIAHSDYLPLNETALKNRNLLKNILEKHGFTELKTEWWHFDFTKWKDFPLLDIRFESL